MTDKELLELAAKAAGMDVVFEPEYLTWFDRGRGRSIWNPLTDDGDALRLAVKCGILNLDDALFYGDRTIDSQDDPYAATRRAIVCAAAEISRKVK